MSTSAPSIAVYTGTFDPVHLGHLDVIRRGCRLVNRLIVGVGVNPEKSPLFDQSERVAMIQKVVRDLPNVEVRPFMGLAVRFVKEVGARMMLRGIRTTSDMEHEFAMSLTNFALDPEIETVFLMAHDHFSHISGTWLRQIANFGGDVGKFVPLEVKDLLIARVQGKESP